MLTLRALGDSFGTVGFSPNGSRLLGASWDAHSYVWSVPSLADLDAEYARQKAAR
jgi:WD40 repeat protein